MLTTLFTGIFVGSVLIQLVYWLGVFVKLALYREKLPDAVSVRGVSVIVCVRNELENLRKLIPVLLAQQHPLFELILVDDRSQGDCSQFLQNQSLAHKNLRVLRIDRTPEYITPKKYALTLGIQAARHEIILLTDADCLPRSTEWISRMQEKFTHDKQIVVGYSPYRYQPGLLNFMIRYETFYTAVQYLSFTLAGLPYMGVGRNLAYTKSLFFGNQGFRSHQHVVGGDDDLFVSQVATRQNVAICIDAPAQVTSEPKRTFADWLQQKKRHVSAGKQYSFRNQLLLGLLTASHLFFWISFAVLLFMPGGVWLAIAGWMLRTVVQMWISRRVAGKLDQTVQWIFIPVFDLLYAVYYLMMGITVSFSKQVRWN